MGSSASLDRSPRKNWVEKSGNLPAYVREIARSIEKGGKSLASAISIAISRIKVWAAGKGVTAKTQAKAAKALAQWEALKAKNASRRVAASAGELTLADMAALELAAAEVAMSPGEDLMLRLTLEREAELAPGDAALDRVLELARTGSGDTKTKLDQSSRSKAADKGNALPDGSFPINNVQDLKNAISSLGRAKDRAAAVRLIKRRARELGVPKLAENVSSGSSVSATRSGSDVLVALGARSPTKEKGTGDGSGKHDLVFFEHRSTPKVLSRGQQLGDYPDSYGKVTSRRSATEEDERKIRNGEWVRKDQSGNKPSDAGYKKTQVRPGLVKASAALPFW